jgi:uncharacterized protein
MTDPDNIDREATGRSKGACPICSRPSEPAVRPFCSKRCADVDLSRWLSGAYAIPVVDADDDEDGDSMDGNSLDDRHPRGFEHDA